MRQRDSSQKKVVHRTESCHVSNDEMPFSYYLNLIGFFYDYFDRQRINCNNSSESFLTQKSN